MVARVFIQSELSEELSKEAIPPPRSTLRFVAPRPPWFSYFFRVPRIIILSYIQGRKETLIDTPKLLYLCI